MWKWFSGNRNALAIDVIGNCIKYMYIPNANVTVKIMLSSSHFLRYVFGFDCGMQFVVYCPLFICSCSVNSLLLGFCFCLGRIQSIYSLSDLCGDAWRQSGSMHLFLVEKSKSLLTQHLTKNSSISCFYIFLLCALHQLWFYLYRDCQQMYANSRKVWTLLLVNHNSNDEH